MSLIGKTSMKKRIYVTAAVAVIAAAALFCGKSKTKDAEGAAVNSGDAAAAAAVSNDGAYDKLNKLRDALNAVKNGEKLEPKNYKNEKDYMKALDSARGARLYARKALFDGAKAEFFKETDFQQDLSGRKMSELLYLRNSIYAVNGLYFKEENLNSYFLNYNSNVPWYSEYMCFLLESAHEKKGGGFVENEKDVKLNEAEKRFVARIDKRIAELRKDSMYVSKDGRTVGDAAQAVNWHKVGGIFGTAYMDKLAQNNFVIVEDEHEQLFHIYEKNNYAKMPSFITTDLFLQAFHIYLSYTLKKLEREKFLPAMETLCRALYNASMKSAKSENAEEARMAEYNAAFYAVAYTLFTGEKANVPEKYQKDYDTEVKYATEARADDVNSAFLASLAPNASQPMSMQYSLFKPRGYYTRKPEMERYFRGMMWLQKAFACRDREAHLKQSIFTAILLNTANTVRNERPLTDVYASVFEPTALLIGEPNNLSVMDIALFLKNENIVDMASALSAENVERVDKHLKSIAERIVIKPKVLKTCADKINFMPQRYLIDNEILQESADVEKRPFPKGLDVFHAFGSDAAGDVLDNFYKEGEKWSGYPAKMAQQRKKFKNFDGWNKSTYNKWLESLTALQKRDKSYPAFMKTEAWDYKNLNTALASWAELKHDFVLYSEQPNAAEAGGDCDDYQSNLPEPDAEVGYVEPNILFWNKLDELITALHNSLAKHNLLDKGYRGLEEKTNVLRENVKFLIEVSKKELSKTPLNNKEYKKIKNIGGEIDNFTLTVLDPDVHFAEWEYVTGPDRSIAAAADIYTGQNGVLHAATGKANAIYVIVEINGSLYITRGATFSYYEFVMPPNTRLTDEEWQAMEADPTKRPAIPEWMRNIITYDKKYPDAKDDVHPIECFIRDGQCYDDEWERDL